MAVDILKDTSAGTFLFRISNKDNKLVLTYVDNKNLIRHIKYENNQQYDLMKNIKIDLNLRFGVFTIKPIKLQNIYTNETVNNTSPKTPNIIESEDEEFSI